MAKYFCTALLLLGCSILCCAAHDVLLRHEMLLTEKHDGIKSQLLSNAQNGESGERFKKYHVPKKWLPPRVKVFTDTIHNIYKQCCYFYSTRSHIPDLFGVYQQCYFYSNIDKDSGPSMVPEKRKIVDRDIAPSIPSELFMYTRVKRVPNNPKPFDFSNVPVCKNIDIPAAHKSQGVRDADIVIYISASPFPNHNYNRPRLMVHKCKTEKDQPIVLVLNINPEYIYQDGIRGHVYHEIQKALQLDACSKSEGRSLILHDEERVGNTLHGKCFNVRCKGTNSYPFFQVKQDGRWVTCPDDNKIPLFKNLKHAMCPPIAEFCSGDVEEELPLPKKVTPPPKQTDTKTSQPSLPEVITPLVETTRSEIPLQTPVHTNTQPVTENQVDSPLSTDNGTLNHGDAIKEKTEITDGHSQEEKGTQSTGHDIQDTHVSGNQTVVEESHEQTDSHTSVDVNHKTTHENTLSDHDEKDDDGLRAENATHKEEETLQGTPNVDDKHVNLSTEEFSHEHARQVGDTMTDNETLKDKKQINDTQSHPSTDDTSNDIIDITENKTLTQENTHKEEDLTTSEHIHQESNMSEKEKLAEKEKTVISLKNEQKHNSTVDTQSTPTTAVKGEENASLPIIHSENKTKESENPINISDEKSEEKMTKEMNETIKKAPLSDLKKRFYGTEIIDSAHLFSLIWTLFVILIFFTLHLC